MKFKLNGKDFSEINPEIRISRLNPMAFVAKAQNERPEKIEIEYDGTPESMTFLAEIAGEIGYYASIEGTLATFERV